VRSRPRVRKAQWKTRRHSDIIIATAQVPKPIATLAQEIGISGDELDPYGKYKAKVDLSILRRLAHRRCCPRLDH
jgi:methylenetetrahydrofolate dehydrogenase (NADP+)/methenyltetrahydrofolate cyclohydrolase/formyltetrahydrofolate synthetase